MQILQWRTDRASEVSMELFALISFVVVALVLSEISLRLVPAFDILTPTLTRFVAMGMGIFGGMFWYSLQHTGLAFSIAMSGCVSLTTIVGVRVARHLIVAAG
jgi:hypothetical protein